MVKNFTPNELVSFIYRETSATENTDIQSIINLDAEMNIAYEQMKSAYVQLPKAQFSPSAQAIQNILKYSQATAVVL